MWAFIMAIGEFVIGLGRGMQTMAWIHGRRRVRARLLPMLFSLCRFSCLGGVDSVWAFIMAISEFAIGLGLGMQTTAGVARFMSIFLHHGCRRVRIRPLPVLFLYVDFLDGSGLFLFLSRPGDKTNSLAHSYICSTT